MFADRPNVSNPGSRRHGARRLLRAVPLALPVVAMLSLSACGSGSGSARAAPDVIIQPTVFVTQPAVTTSSTLPLGEGEEVPDGTRAQGTQTYTVQANDNLYAIASAFEVDINDIVALNEWSGINQPLFPGNTIQIPPGGVDASVVERNRSGGSNSNSSTRGDDQNEDALVLDSEPDDELCANGDPRPTYTIKQGDIPTRVATALDVTVEQLREANSGSNVMTSFMVGAELLLPCPADD